MTVRELIQRTELQFAESDLFYGHGTDNPLDEAFYLVMTAADLAFDCAEEELDVSLDTEKLEYIESLINKRIHQRIPVAYLVNKAWFAGHEFFVDERVLIPRSPVAELIHSQFTPWLVPQQVTSILDIGTGSACIAIACAHAFPHATVDAVDIDEDAIEVARRNVADHQLHQRVQVIQSNLYQQLENKRYDIIISNPPYVGNAEMRELPEEYRHEPGRALEADNNGLAIVDQILAESTEHLNENGILIVEV